MTAVLKYLPNRTKAAIWSKARHIRIRRRHVYEFTPILLSDYERGWLEALIDSEGCIGLCKIKMRRLDRGSTWDTYAVIFNSNKNLLEKAMAILKTNCRIDVVQQGNSKPVYRLHLNRNCITALFPQIQLIAKETQRQLLLEAIDLISEHQPHYTVNYIRLTQIYEEMKKLNKRGIN